MREGQSFQQLMLGTLYIYTQKYELKSFLISDTKINSKWIKHKYIRPEGNLVPYQLKIFIY